MSPSITAVMQDKNSDYQKYEIATKKVKNKGVDKQKQEDSATVH